MPPKLGLIAGNGRFPFLVLDAARARGYEVVVAAIKEETFPEIEHRAAANCVHWLSLGELSKLIKTFQREGVTEAVMAGQVKHKQIFSSIRPDWRLAKLLLNLRTRNTDALIGAVAKVLADEGITLRSSTELLEPLLAKSGVLTRRPPSQEERSNIDYGRDVARHLAQYDIGQTVVIAERACVAVEAMEGTDACIRRAGDIMRSGPVETGLAPSPLAPATSQPPKANGSAAADDQWPTTDDTFLNRALTVVKIAKPHQDMRFDVPVVGVVTIETMHASGATCLALDAGKCLLIDGDKVITAADTHAIAIVAD